MNILASLIIIALIAFAYGEVRDSCSQMGKFALTFNGGPSKYTGNLISILRERQVRVTLHVNPKNLVSPSLLANMRQAVADGHLIGIALLDVTIDYRNYNSSELEAIIRASKETVSKLLNYNPRYLRFPAGRYTDEMVKVAESVGLTVSSYNYDSEDYKPTSQLDKGQFIFRGFKAQVDSIQPPAKGDFISVQSDLIEESVAQTGAIVDYLKEKGYDIVTLDQCFGVPESQNIESKSGQSASANSNEAVNQFTSSLDSLKFLLLLLPIILFF